MSVVLVHGVGCAGSIWDDVVALLAVDDVVEALDLPGTGGSPPLGGPVTVPALAAVVRRHIEARGLDDVVLVGHSLGGMVAQELACSDPTGLRALVVCNSVAAGGDVIGEINEGFATIAERDGPAALAAVMAPHLVGSAAGEGVGAMQDRVTELFEATGAELLAAQLRAVRTFDATDRLAGLRVPTLVVIGPEDGGADLARAIAGLVPGAASVELAGAGHMAPMESPAAFVAALRSFLGTLDDGEAR